MQISVRSLTKRFGNFIAVDNLDLDIVSGELVALLGPSGSGKTTLLRIIAGLEQPDHGTLAFGTQDVTGANAKSRGVGFVFQHYALFRHMTVAENVAFGLSVQPRAIRLSGSAITSRVDELLRMVQLDGYARRFPHQLSGGQRQRVALARALAVQPRVLLLDEPFGALDAKVRIDLRRWLRRLHDETGITSVFVTHDQEEALEVADRIVVLNHGKIEQIGTPDQVYRHPATAFVHHFLGQVNIFHERLQDGETQVALVRPHDVRLARVADAQHHRAAVVEIVNLAGPVARIGLRLVDNNRDIEAHLTHQDQKDLAIARGDHVFVGFTDSRSYAGSDLSKLGGDYQI